MNLKGKIILAPMEEVTDIAFRMTCKEYGADIVWTEMMHTKRILAGKVPKVCKEERPIVVQVAGKSVDEVVETAKIVERHCDAIDVNFGCPGKNVISSGYGSALLNNLELIRKIISELKNNITKPVLAKIRIGFTKVNAFEIAKVIQDAGANAITIHARTTKQKYTGKADWNIIKKVHEFLKIPVIGNGDIRTGQDAENAFKMCDSIMIGRAAIGNPLIFKKIKMHMRGKKYEETIKERIQAFEKYIEYAKKYDVLTKVKVLRQAQYFTKGYPKATKFRNELCSKKTETIIKKTIDFLQHQETTGTMS